MVRSGPPSDQPCGTTAIGQLVALLETFDRKRHSGGDLVTGFEDADALVAMRSVAVADVAGERPGEGVPVDVVGVVDDELADREEVTLDRVEVAGVGGSGHELDPVAGGEG